MSLLKPLEMSSSLPITNKHDNDNVGCTIIITGGGGFLGQYLAIQLCKLGTVLYDKNNKNNNDQSSIENIDQNNNNNKDEDNINNSSDMISIPIHKIILADIIFHNDLMTDRYINNNNNIINIIKIKGDISNKLYCESLFHNVTSSYMSIFHLGAIMSGDGERDFDLCINVNLYGCINMLECSREYKQKYNNSNIKFIFVSAGAIIGCGSSTDYITKDDTISDQCRSTPHTTYGMTKACCELLCNDYYRKGYIDYIIGIRLPTIIVRAGLPNAATTSCFSSIIREPLNNVNVIIPVDPTIVHAVTSTRCAILSIICCHNISKLISNTILGDYDRTIFIPAIPISLQQLHDALDSIIIMKESSNKSHLGTITYELDERISNIVASFPIRIDAYRAKQLGVPEPPMNAKQMIYEYIQDFPYAISSNLVFDTPTTSTIMANSTTIATATTPNRIFPDRNIITPNTRIAIITGGGSGIGQAVTKRLIEKKDNEYDWIVVIVGRTLEKLYETKNLLQNNNDQMKCICIVLDVTIENDVKRVITLIYNEYHRIDLLFNNAGMNIKANSIEEVDVKDFISILQTNVIGPFICTKEVMKYMIQNGNGGRIINNGSISCTTPRPHSVGYTTSKHALLGLTKCIALDGRQYNIACSHIDFGNVMTQLSSNTNTSSIGAFQSNGTYLKEPFISLIDAANSVALIANLSLEANIYHMTLMATNMPYVGRG